jgi:hypothetical protein
LTRFTIEQYDKAIQHLQDARTQLAPDGHGCHCCGGSGHQAFECGHNPLVAMQMCEMITKRAVELHEALHDTTTGICDLFKLARHSDQSIEQRNLTVMAAAADEDMQELLVTLHEFLHSLAGMNMYMGMQLGPARVVLP